eukprot:Selendium_serpulae@DN2352_c0_g1_i1.p1
MGVNDRYLSAQPRPVLPRRLPPRTVRSFMGLESGVDAAAKQLTRPGSRLFNSASWAASLVLGLAYWLYTRNATSGHSSRFFSRTSSDFTSDEVRKWNTQVVANSGLPVPTGPTVVRVNGPRGAAREGENRV